MSKFKEMNIYEKLLNISNDIKPISKDMEVGTGRGSYKAVGEAQVKDTVKPVEFKYGVYSYPKEIEIVQQEIIRTESTYNGKTEEKTKFFVRALITFRFVNTDKPEEYCDQQTFGDGVDPLDKSAGKAMTYALKYGLINAYKMISGEDPDQFHSSDNEIKQTKKDTRKPREDYQPPQDEDETTELAIKKGLAIVLNKLKSDDNVEFKPNVMQTMCEKYKVDKWGDIRFSDYKKFINEVKDELEKQKNLKEIGI